MPCYDFAPVTSLTLTPANAEALGITSSLGVTGDYLLMNIRIDVPTQRADFPH